MKRCPNCNRTFEEDWLAFCTQDGTTLIDESPAKKDDLQATILAPAPPPPSGGWQSPSGDLGFRAVSVANRWRHRHRLRADSLWASFSRDSKCRGAGNRRRRRLMRWDRSRDSPSRP
jgi:hypothetical protein